MAETTMPGATLAGATTAPEFRIGKIIIEAFAILFRNIVPFGLLTLVVTSPLLVFSLITTPSVSELDASGGMSPDMATSLVFTTFSGFLLQILLYNVATAALVFGTVQDLRGQRASFGDCLRRGLATVFPVIVISILVFLLVGFASLLLLIPGIIVFTMLWVAIPVAVIERPGITASLGRSRQLTKGFRWRVLAIYVLLLILALVIGGLIGLVFGAGAFVGGGTGIADFPTIAIVVDYLVQAFFTALMAVAVAVGYYALRASKEGVDIEQIAAVFD